MDNKQCAPWDDNAFAFQANGYSVIPLAPREKGPRLQNWSVYCEQFMDKDAVRSFYGKSHNIGCCLGKASRTMAIDVDTDDEELIIKVRRILPPSPVEKRGAKGFTAFYQWEGQSSQSLKNGKDGLDILAHGRQTVLPPSIHPKGMPYIWTTERTLLEVKPEQLPVITDTQMAQLKALFQRKYDNPSVVTRPVRSAQQAKMEEVQDALTYIDPDESYEKWVEIGMAIQAEFGESGWELFNTWSARGTKYDGHAKCWRKYSSFTRDGVGIGTLFHYALANGFEAKNPWGDSLPEEIFDEKSQKDSWDVLQVFMQGGEEEIEAQRDEVLLSPPGLLGDIYNWLTQCNPLYQPMYIIPGAIAAVSLIYAHKLKTDTGARSNLYVMSIGPTGSGKTVAANLVMNFFGFLPPHYMKLMLGEPKSDAGLIDALIAAGGRGLLCIDEIGHYLALLKSGSSNAYTMAVGAEFTKLFSRANGIYKSAAYSTNSKKASVEIHNPCLVIFGQSVKDKVFKEIREDDFVDGFFNRWLIFESEVKMPTQNTDYTQVERNSPNKIVEFINRADKRILDAQMSSNAAAMTTGGIACLEVKKTLVASKMLAEFSAKINTLRQHETGMMDYPMSRAIEHVEKLSLVACEWSSDFTPMITDKSVAWAIAAVEHNLRQVQSKLELLSSSDYDITVRKVLSLIPVGKMMTQSSFANKIGFLTPKMRKEVLSDLLVRKNFEWVTNENGKYLTRKK